MESYGNLDAIITLDHMPPIGNKYNSAIKEESSNNMSQFNSEFDDSENRNKAVVYWKRRQTINDSPVYTINKESEAPPNINNLFSLKVKVPKVKVSKYFQDKYNSSNHQRNVLKLNDSQF